MSMGTQASRPARSQIVLDSLKGVYEFSVDARTKAREIRLKLLGEKPAEVKDQSDKVEKSNTYFDMLDDHIADIKGVIRDINDLLGSVLNELI